MYSIMMLLERIQAGQFLWRMPLMADLYLAR